MARDIKKEKELWDKYWEEEKDKSKLSLKKKILLFVRNKIFLPEAAHYLNKYFNEGTFLEAGSGSGIASSRLKKQGKTIIAMDLSKDALEECKKNPNIDKTIQGDIFNIPLKDNTLDGIWNSGVMEHFDKEDVLLLLKEFNRVLKGNGKIVLFWPSTKLPASWLMNQVIILGLRLPRNVWSPRRQDIMELLNASGYIHINIKISPTLIHYIVIGEK